MIKEILGKNGKIGGLTHPDLKIHYKATLGKTVCYWHKDRHVLMEQSKELRHKLATYSQLILAKVPQITHWEKCEFFKSFWKNWIATCKRQKWNPYFTPYTKLGSFTHPWILGQHFAELRRERGRRDTQTL